MKNIVFQYIQMGQIRKGYMDILLQVKLMKKVLLYLHEEQLGMFV